MFTLITVWAMGIFFILYMGTSVLSTYPHIHSLWIVILLFLRILFLAKFVLCLHVKHLLKSTLIITNM